MATKYAKSPRVKRGKLDFDIEKVRVEGNWLKLNELVQQAVKLNSSLGPLSELLYAESKLELCDKENPSQEDLEAADKHLKAASKITDESYKIDYKIISAKLYFLQAKHKEVVDLLESLNLKNLRIDNPAARVTLLIAEGFAMLGLSMEKLHKTSGVKQSKPSEHDEKILEYFDLSGDLCILFLQEIEKAGVTVYVGNETTMNMGIPKAIETAVQRSPIIHIQNGELNRAVHRLRQVLRYVETVCTKGLRQTLARQLAEVLLRGVCNNSYQKYLVSSKDNYTNPIFFKLTSKQVALYPSDRFVPEDHIQEAVLMLLISEYIANQEAILNRSPELSDARVRTLHNTTAVYDLLAIALVRKGCYNYLSKTMEHALKFSYKEFHIWYQFALSLISAKKYQRAYLVLQECQRIEENHTEVYFFMASLALEELHQLEDGLEAAEKAIEVAPPVLKARAHLLAGWANSIMAKECRVSEKKKEFHQYALKNYNTGVETDPDDHLIWYHLALEQAILRQLDSAMSACHRCLSLHPGFAAGLHLLTLLHTASGQTGQAAQVIAAAIYEHPNNISLLLTKAKIDAIVDSPETALQSYKSLIEMWKDKYAPDYDSSGFLDKLKTQYNALHCSDMLDRDSGSHRAESLAATRLENALSEIASSLSCTAPKVGISHSSYLQMQILLNLGELYIDLDKLREASECIEEAANISKLNHNVLYMRGRLYEAKGSNIDARRMYESTASINPSHVKTLQRLGSILQVFGEFQLAEKVLRDALSYDSTSSKTWQCLGDVLQSLNQNEASTQCYVVGADLEQTEPIEPFYFLPKGINIS